MNRLLLTISAIIYLATTTGATIHMHFCMGKLVDTSFWLSEEDKCSVCGMDKAKSEENGCCSDKHEQIKIQGDQKIGSLFEFQTLQIMGVAILPQYIIYPESRFINIAVDQPVSNAPPRRQDQPVYLLNRSFLI